VVRRVQGDRELVAAHSLHLQPTPAWPSQ
jgi:hypothetical protein